MFSQLGSLLLRLLLLLTDFELAWSSLQQPELRVCLALDLDPWNGTRHAGVPRTGQR